MNSEQSISPPKDVPSNNPIEIRSSDGETVLRQFTPEDAGEIFNLIDRNRDHLSQFGDDTAGKYPTHDSVKDSIENPKNPDRLRFTIRNKERQLVGSINITPDKKNPKQAEIGYYLGSEFQKKGYMKRALEVLLDYGFQNLGYDTIYGDVVDDNVASVKTLLACGFQEVGRFKEKIRY